MGPCVFWIEFDHTPVELDRFLDAAATSTKDRQVEKDRGVIGVDRQRSPVILLGRLVAALGLKNSVAGERVWVKPKIWGH